MTTFSFESLSLPNGCILLRQDAVEFDYRDLRTAVFGAACRHCRWWYLWSCHRNAVNNGVMVCHTRFGSRERAEVYVRDIGLVLKEQVLRN